MNAPDSKNGKGLAVLPSDTLLKKDYNFQLLEEHPKGQSALLDLFLCHLLKITPVLVRRQLIFYCLKLQHLT